MRLTVRGRRCSLTSQPTIQAGARPPAAIVLAAGRGTRMPGHRPKVVYEVGGRPMVGHVIDACIDAGCARILLVVGYQQEQVRAAVGDRPAVEYVVQQEQLGTGHAVRCAESLLRDEISDPGHLTYVLCGDGPLVTAALLRQLSARHRATHAAATLATACLDDPSGYGRIVRDQAGRFLDIVEERDCTAEQRRICEVNPSYYCFTTAELFAALRSISPSPHSGEYYVTAVPALLRRMGRTVQLVDGLDADLVRSINTPEELATVDALVRRRLSATEQIPQ